MASKDSSPEVFLKKTFTTTMVMAIAFVGTAYVYISYF